MTADWLKTVLLDPAVWRRIEAQLNELLDFEPPEREARLAELTVHAPEDAAQLRELLAKCEAVNAEGFLDGPPLALAELESLARISLPGEHIGSYMLERHIGTGGMGEVWLASRADGHYEAHCAIKLLDVSPASPILAQRFRDESRLLARLDHPNIARLIDAGTSTGGQQFLILEYVEGERIDEYCRSRQLGPKAIVRLLADVTAAVAHAHSSLIAHGDLKPANVLVRADGVVKLLDFGIAKLLRAETDVESIEQVERERIALTPAYAAPEQLLGEPPSTAADIYQLGALSYALLTGRSHLTTPQNRGTLPRDLDAILAKALNPEKSHRYETAMALREDLIRHLNHEPVSARNGSSMYRFYKLITRHRVAAAGAFLTIVGQCLLLAIALFHARVAVEERNRSAVLASRNESVAEFMQTLISDAATSAKPLTVPDMLTHGETLASRGTTGNPESDAAVLEAIAAHYDSLGNHERSAELLQAALSRLGNSSAHDLRSTIVCEYAMANAFSKHEEVERGFAIVERELKDGIIDPLARATCLRHKSHLAWLSEDKEGALRDATAALEQIRSIKPLPSRREADFLEGVANAHYLNGHSRDAFEYHRQALQRYAALGLEGSADATVARNNMAVVSSAAGIPKQALESFDESLRLHAQGDPSSDPAAYLIVNRAAVLEAIGRYREAREGYESALQLARREKSKDSQVYSLLGLASVATATGALEDAGRALERVTPLIDSPTTPTSTVAAKLTLAQGELALRVGELDRAQRFFASVANAQRPRPTTVKIELDEAEICLLRSQGREAATHAEAALKLAVALEGGLPYSNYVGLAWLTVGRARKLLGQESAAHAAFDAAATNLEHTVDENHPALIRAQRLASGAAE